MPCCRGYEVRACVKASSDMPVPYCHAYEVRRRVQQGHVWDKVMGECVHRYAVTCLCPNAILHLA